MKQLTRRELAALPDLPGQVGPVHMQTVTKWEQEGMPVAHRGRKGRPSTYSEVEVRAWLTAREEAAENGSALDLVQERARKEHWQALLAEQTHKARSKELLPAAEVERSITARVAAARTTALAWKTMLIDRLDRARTIDGMAGMERVMEASVHEFLSELAGDRSAAAEAPAKRKRRVRAA